MEQQELKVGFLNHFNKWWVGGITYFKNLFRAMETTNSPRLKPYIYRSPDELADCLLPYVSLFPEPPLKADPENLPTAADYGMDVLSHLNGNQIAEGRDGIAWIADFQHVHLPEMFDEREIAFRNHSFHTLIARNRIVCLSSYDAMEDFKKYAPESADKARCLHFVSIPEPGTYDFTDAEAAAICSSRQLPERYFYVPNQFWKHKNHIAVLRALALLKKSGAEIHVVFSGNTLDARFPHYFEELQAFCREQGIEENVHFLGLIPLKEVYFLMRNCVAMINPSKFEGWSSSVEEAKSIGKTILLSNLNVHYEQMPPHGSYFPCDDPEWLADLMQRAWEDLKPGPDLAMEKQARQMLPFRIQEFGRDFQRIVLDAVENRNSCAMEAQSAPDVTVITVTGDLRESKRQELLLRNLDSVAAQKGVRVEHLIVNRTADDETAAFLRSCVEKYPCKLLSETAHGIYGAMNCGAIQAQGKYVAFLDADAAYLAPDFLQNSVDALEKGKFDFSYAPAEMHDAAGVVADHLFAHPDEVACFTEMPFCRQAMLFGRKALYNVAVFNDTLTYAGDCDLLLRLILQGKRGIRVDQTGVSAVIGNDADPAAQQECDALQSRHYGRAGFAVTPAAMRSLRSDKESMAKLRALLQPHFATAFGASRPDLCPVVPAVQRSAAPAPLISVIFPLAGNVFPLAKRIEALKNQRWSDFEVLALNCGDPARKELAGAWAKTDPRVRLLDGATDPWNSGIAAARGKYLYFADGDILPVPDALGNMAAALNRHPECAICDTRLQLTDAQGNVTSPIQDHDRYFGHLAYPANQRLLRLAPCDLFQALCGKKVYASPGQLMIRRNLFEQTGDYPADAGSAGFYLWNLYAALHANVVYLPEISASWCPPCNGEEDFFAMHRAANAFLAQLPEGVIKQRAAGLATLFLFKEMLLPLKNSPSKAEKLKCALRAFKTFPKKSLRLAFLMMKYHVASRKTRSSSMRANNALIAARMKQFHGLLINDDAEPHLSKTERLRCCLDAFKDSPKKGLQLALLMAKSCFKRGSEREMIVQRCNALTFAQQRKFHEAIRELNVVPYSQKQTPDGNR